jgi:hypothetical protein
MTYVCNNCYRIHAEKSLAKDPDGKYYCSRPGCNMELIELDEIIAPVIIALWKKGYDTLSCCSGHYKGSSYNVPYIVFSERGRKDFENLPEGFVVNKCGTGVILEPEEFDEMPDMHTILKRNDELLYWAEQRENLDIL